MPSFLYMPLIIPTIIPHAQAVVMINIGLGYARPDNLKNPQHCRGEPNQLNGHMYMQN